MGLASGRVCAIGGCGRPAARVLCAGHRDELERTLFTRAAAAYRADRAARQVKSSRPAGGNPGN